MGAHAVEVEGGYDVVKGGGLGKDEDKPRGRRGSGARREGPPREGHIAPEDEH